MKNALYIRFFQPLITGIIVLFSVLTSYGQLYPVQATVVTTPPYYNYMAYYGDQNNHLQVIATFTDFASPPIMARLRFTIEGAGFIVRTRQDIPVGTPFTLSPGVPVFMQGSDLLPYLSQNNLELVSGNVDFENLPEGFTTICVEVVKDGVASEIVSNNACTAFFLQYMQPPQAFLPVCNSVVDTAAMFQTFQWSPPQNYIPSVGSDLSYTFSLYEWIDTTNYNIFQSGQGLVYQTQTTFPMVQVSNFDVLWQQGRKYVWRVQAQLTSNGLPVQMFTQDGLSAPCSFYYGHQVSLAETLSSGLSIDVTAEALASRKGRAMWTVTDETPGEGLSTYSSYIVEYRRKPYDGENYTYQWLYDTVFANQQPLWRLEPEETYQVRVRGIAGDYVSDPSEMAEFTTPPLREYACGEADLPYVPANYTPLASAQMGDIFQIGQFELEVTHVDPLQLPGHFQGRGLIKHGFIGGAKVKVRFDDLLVDNNYLVREGQAVAVTSGSDNWLNEEYLNQVVPDTVNGVIESGGFLNDSTVFVVVNGDSLFFSFENDLPIVVYGDNNVAYQFWPNGTLIITTYGITVSNDDLDAKEALHTYFEQAPNEPGGFDKKQYPQFNDNYEIIVCQDQYQYVVSNASKSTSGTSQVKAIIHGAIPSFLPSQLTFELAGGNTQVPYTQLNDSTFLLTLPARSYDYMVYAIYADLKLGKLNVKSYAPITKKVRIVPLVAMSITEAQIETELNQIYKGANLTIDATIAPQFNTPEFTTSTEFANPDVSLMSKYTAQMRALRDTYLAENEVESGTYLVFIIPEFADPAIDGYMVRGRGLGFVAQSTLANVPTFAHTLAHELGHGIGGLKHAWGETESLKGGTNNLMDYSSGTQLIKKQWDALREPGITFSLLDSEEESSSYDILGSNIDVIYETFPNDNGSITFIDPSGRIITLPQGVTEIVFASPDSYWKSASTGIVDVNETPIGALIVFKLPNGVRYHSSKHPSSNTFLGYYTDDSPSTIYPNNSAQVSEINYALAGIPCIINGNIKFKICPMNLEAILQNGTESIAVGGTLIPQEKFKFINYYMTASSDAQGIEVVAKFTTQLSNQVLQYLQSVRADVNGKEAVYAFQVAYLLQTNKIVGNCIAGLNNAVNLVIDAERQNEIIIEDQANFNEFHTQVSDNTDIQVNIEYQPMSILSIEQDESIFQPTVDYGEDPEYFRKYYYALADWISRINKQVDYTEDVITGQNINIADYTGFIFKNLRSDQRACYLSSLTSFQRVKILREYSDFAWSSQKERLFLEVLETAPEDQYSYLLNAFQADNYSLLKGLNGDLWFGDNYRLFMAVSLMALKHQNVEFTDIPEPTIGNYNTQNLPYHIILQKNGDHTIRVVAETNWYNSGSIGFTSKWYFPGQPMESQHVIFDPYEIVIVQFEDNYQFSGIDGGQIHKGDMVAVPAMFAYWLILEQDKIESTKAIRVIIDLAAITASVATANPGPFLIADAVLSTVDLVFAVNEDYILSEGTAKQKELLGNWNMLATVVGAANGVYLIQKVTANSLRFTFDRAIVRNRIKSWRNTDEIRLEDAGELFQKVYKNSQSNIFTSGYNTMKQELALLMREVEINRIMTNVDDVNVGLVLSENGGQNLLRFSYADDGIENTIDLCYIDPDNQGRMVMSTLQFLENDQALIDKVLMVIDDVNFTDANGELALGKKLTIVKTKAGGIKVVVGKVILTKFNNLAISSINGFPDNIGTLLNSHTLNGEVLTLEQFKALIYRSTTETVEGIPPLTVEEMAYVNAIRNSIPTPNSNTIMQKVMPVSYKDAYFVSDGNPKSIGGYMTTANDAKHLDSYQEIFDGMRLDYASSDFVSSGATECLVIRFKSNNTGNLNIPRNKNNGGVLNDPSISDPFNKNSYPFTGNGFTSGKNGTLGVPEWKADFGNNLELLNGAEMYIIKSDGTETLIGTYNSSVRKFINN